jgi:ribonuclease HI
VNGHVLDWRCACAPATTCNEAEYQALIVGLQWVLEHNPQCAICCLSDSQTVVEQMCGRARVRAGLLQPLHAQATHLAGNFVQISYVAISRELNRLADALAWEALGGRRSIVRALQLER